MIQLALSYNLSLILDLDPSHSTILISSLKIVAFLTLSCSYFLFKGKSQDIGKMVGFIHRALELGPFPFHQFVYLFFHFHPSQKKTANKISTPK